ncbi:hypothetical protein [Pseudomonas faucium]|uniref:hypothetical protein n=1 Tax=Pseudomonas faucium TaxID=2740518 RepID=UPI0039C3BD56
MSCKQNQQNPDFIYLDKTGEVGTVSLAPGSKDLLLLTGNSGLEDSAFTVTSLDREKQETLLATHYFEPGDELFFGLSAQPRQDDTLFLAGALWGDDLYPAFARLKSTGSLDTSFGDCGTKVLRDLASRQATPARALSVQTTAMASYATPSPTAHIPLPGGGYLVASAETGYLLRLKENGDLDNSFGDGGKLKPAPHGAEGFELTNAALRSEDVMVVIGNAGAKGIIATYDMSGRPIDGFNGKGVVTFEHEASVNLMNLTFSPDQSAFTIVGMTHVNGQRRALVARLDALDGSLDAGFNNGRPFHLELKGYETSFLQVASRLNKGQEERIYAVGGVIAFPTPGFVAAAFDKHGLVQEEFPEGVVIGKQTTLANSMLLLQDPPRLVVGGGIRMKDSNDFQGFVALYPLSL